MQEQTFVPFEKPNRITVQSNISNKYTIKLWDEILEPSEYMDEIDLINNATENDVIYVDLCTPGGCADTAMLFHRSLKACQANTVAIIGPTTASAGGVIALSCRDFILDDTSSLMIHTSAYGYAGKDVDVYEHANFSRMQLKAFYEQVFTGFLTEEELSDVLKGQPFYFDAEQIADRLDRMIEYREGCEQLDLDSESEGCDNHPTLEQMIENAVEKAFQKQSAYTSLDKIAEQDQKSGRYEEELNMEVWDKVNTLTLDNGERK